MTTQSLLGKILKFFTLTMAFVAMAAQAENLHLIEADSETGFALYRSGKPDREDMREICDLGVDEVMVLSGNADDYEFRYQEECPNLRVIYNVKQSDRIPVTETFLEEFDAWVEEARATGKKILFRCNCGCHRTGRLAAYYQMKYQGLSSDEAIDIMNDLGKWMWFFGHLKKQVRALEDYIEGESCSQSRKHCVREESPLAQVLN